MHATRLPRQLSSQAYGKVRQDFDRQPDDVSFRPEPSRQASSDIDAAKQVADRELGSSSQSNHILLRLRNSSNFSLSAEPVIIDRLLQIQRTKDILCHYNRSSSTNLRSGNERSALPLGFYFHFPSLAVRFKRIATLSAERYTAARYLTR